MSRHTVGANQLRARHNMFKKALFRLLPAALIGLLLLVATSVALHEATTVATSRTHAHEIHPGDVVINEVAWMGTAASSWDEWIELHNTTDEAITLTAWRIEFGDGSPATITLTGVITPTGYYLLERDEGTTDIPADLVYGGSRMHNDGESMTLKDAQGTVIDTANGNGGFWPAGDNDVKRTMERKDPGAAGTDSNWANNDGVNRNGHDADGQLLARR